MGVVTIPDTAAYPAPDGRLRRVRCRRLLRATRWRLRAGGELAVVGLEGESVAIGHGAPRAAIHPPNQIGISRAMTAAA